jgi:hypothetical protein
MVNFGRFWKSSVRKMIFIMGSVFWGRVPKLTHNLEVLVQVTRWSRRGSGGVRAPPTAACLHWSPSNPSLKIGGRRGRGARGGKSIDNWNKVNEKALCRAFSNWRTTNIPLCRAFFVWRTTNMFFHIYVPLSSKSNCPSKQILFNLIFFYSIDATCDSLWWTLVDFENHLIILKYQMQL